ncbi:MAG TPA: hypothetical protein VFC78_17635 [Tepidisphaeraceae bacterium]|nr:hypothetical protein [Tepidisphaeraceae bacterium]
MWLLKPMLRDHDKAVAADAQKLLADVKAEGEKWKDEAEKIADDKPVEAFVLYSRVAEAFTGDELGKSVAAPLKKLRTNKAVKDEMGARQMFAQVTMAMSKAKPEQKARVAQFAESIAKKYPEAPTGIKAAALAEELKG